MSNDDDPAADQAAVRPPSPTCRPRSPGRSTAAAQVCSGPASAAPRNLEPTSRSSPTHPTVGPASTTVAVAPPPAAGPASAASGHEGSGHTNPATRAGRSMTAKAEPTQVGTQRDRRAALSTHYAKREQSAAARRVQPTAATAADRREAAIQRATEALQKQCADLAAAMSAAQARQGQLVQRLARASQALVEPAPSASPAGPAAAPALSSMIASLRGALSGRPR